MPMPRHIIVEGMMQYEMVEETAELMWRGLKQGAKMNVIINNRSEGNAPLIGQADSKEIFEFAV